MAVKLNIFPVIWKYICNIYRIADAVVDNADRHHIFLLASGIAFNVILFILPAMLVMIYSLQKIVEPTTILTAVGGFVKGILPSGQDSEMLIGQVLDEVRSALSKSSKAGWIGIPALLWVSSTLFTSLRTGLNGVFEMSEPGFFLKYRLKDIALLVLFTFIVVVSSLATTILTLVESVSKNVLPSEIFGIFYNLSAVTASAVISFIFFLFLYYFVPNKKLPPFILWGSTALSTILWEVAKYVFAWYMSNISSYGTLYGVFATAAATALWLYYSSFILLLSGEIMQYWYSIRQGN